FDVLTLWAALLTTVVLGAGYGITLVAGLQEVDRMAGPRELASLTAVFYSLAYLGFGLPALLSFLSERFGFGYPVMYRALAAGAAAVRAAQLPGAAQARTVNRARFVTMSSLGR